MEILNRSRQLFQQLNQRNKPKESEIADAISAGIQLKTLTKTAGWKRVGLWIEKQDDGIKQFMEHETQVVSLWSILKMVNLFIKYLMMLHEHRAYKKLQTFVEMSIRKGNEYAIQRAKFEQQRKQGQKRKTA